jgi:Zn-dependent protease with chaperone function
MLGSLFLVLILYLVFLAAAGLLAYFLVILPIPHLSGRALFGYLFFKFGGAFAILLIWLFLLKGLFKKTTVEKSSYVEIKEKDHPEIFSFIRQLCQDTRAPRPRRVYASPEVNAALVYNTSLLNLVVPPRKDLMIGLGLVNVVNLSEFKAVLAHEFGHFAQRSVKLGSYVYVANRVMHDLVYSRDALDDFVDGWSRQDFRIAFPAWGLKGMLWAIRKLLASIFEALNVLHLSLGRQMEFNADNVAVSVTGSDAIVHALSRLDFASECLTDVSRGLDAAADQHLFTDDLFYHQTRAADRLRRLRGSEQLGLPPALPEDREAQVQVFQPQEDGIPDRYRTHPTLYMREKNAKRFYVRSPQDERPAWLLFGDADGLKRDVTGRFYRHTLDRREAYKPQPARDVQHWLDAEHAEMTFDPEYQGLYDGRFIDPGKLDDLPEQPWQAEEIAAALHAWSGEVFKQQLEAFRKRQGEYQLLSNLASGEWKLKGPTFPFRGKERTAKEIKGLFEQVDKELDADIEAFNRLDRQIFHAHWSLARLADGPGDAAGPCCRELLERYRFHLAIQALFQGMQAEQGRLLSVFQYIAAKQRFEEDEFRQIQKTLEEAYNTLTLNLKDAKQWKAPALTNVEAGTSLYSLIVDRGDPLPAPVSGSSISGEWLSRLAGSVDGVLKRINRLQFKSLGALLAFQQKLRRAESGTPAGAALESVAPSVL